MARPFYFGTNTKMYKNSSQTEAFVRELVELTADIDRSENPLFVIPSLTTIERARKSVPVEKLKIGAQNIHWAEEGQFTGEVSVNMLTDIGADLVMVAHSERRQLFNETNQSSNKKILTTLKHGLIALLCGQICRGRNPKSEEVLRTQQKLVLELWKKRSWIDFGSLMNRFGRLALVESRLRRVMLMLLTRSFAIHW